MSRQHRAYIRVDPVSFEHKAFGYTDDEGRRHPAYPPAAVAAFYGILCLAEQQPERGVFRTERLLRVLLEGQPETKAYTRQLPFLFAQSDVIRKPDGQLYVDGWEEWQEGDWQVIERVRRIRNRPRVKRKGDDGPDTSYGVTPVTPNVTPPTVYTPQGGSGSGSDDISGSGSGPADPALEAYQRFQTYPSPRALRFLDDLVETYGQEATARAIGKAGEDGRTDLLSRARTLLALEQREAERAERAAEATKVEEQHRPIRLVAVEPPPELSEDEIERQVAEWKRMHGEEARA